MNRTPLNYRMKFLGIAFCIWITGSVVWGFDSPCSSTVPGSEILAVPQEFQIHLD